MKLLGIKGSARSDSLFTLRVTLTLPLYYCSLLFFLRFPHSAHDRFPCIGFLPASTSNLHTEKTKQLLVLSLFSFLLSMASCALLPCYLPPVNL